MDELITLGENAVRAKRELAVSTGEARNSALCAAADALQAEMCGILSQNALDLEAGRAGGLSEAMLDRLVLDEKRITDIANSIRDIVRLPDPVGRVLREATLQNGLKLKKLSVPIGVIAVIFEARPNVAADSAALCLKSGNAVILRGGKEAIRSNTAIVKTMREAIAKCGLTPDAVQLVSDTSHESATALMRLSGYVDLLIPRGGKNLIKSIVKNATVPVIETGAGTCHIYVDKAADIEMAARVIDNAKTSRPSVCNAAECILVHKDIAKAALPVIAKPLLEKHVQLRADGQALKLLPEAVPATDADWGFEYDDYILAVKIVADMDEALEHIARYGTGHSESIITRDTAAAEYFLSHVDAAAVYHNASTRFTDGGVFGLGAEIGISTQKLHARGPLGLEELTSMKYVIRGDGQIR